MAFEFGSAGHEKLVTSLLAQAKERMPSNHFECIEKIQKNPYYVATKFKL